MIHLIQHFPEWLSPETETEIAVESLQCFPNKKKMFCLRVLCLKTSTQIQTFSNNHWHLPGCSVDFHWGLFFWLCFLTHTTHMRGRPLRNHMLVIALASSVGWYLHRGGPDQGTGWTSHIAMGEIIALLGWTIQLDSYLLPTFRHALLAD